MDNVAFNTLEAQVLLAQILREQSGVKNLDDAKDLLEYTLKLCPPIHSESDLAEIAMIRSELALVLLDLDGKENLDKAVKLLRSDSNLFVEQLGYGHSSLVKSRSTLALVLLEIEEEKGLQEALQLLEEAREYAVEFFGESSLQLSQANSNLAKALSARWYRGFDHVFRLDDKIQGPQDNKDIKRAIELVQEAIYIMVIHLGETSPKVAQAYTDLAILFLKAGGREYLERATELLNLSLSLFVKSYGAKHPKVARAKVNLAILFAIGGEMHNLELGVKLLEEALTLDIANFGEDHPVVARTKSTLAHGIFYSNNLSFYDPSFDVKRIKPENWGRRTYLDAFNVRLEVIDDLKKYNITRAARLFEESIETIIKNFGNEHPFVENARRNLRYVHAIARVLGRSIESETSRPDAGPVKRSAKRVGDGFGLGDVNAELKEEAEELSVANKNLRENIASLEQVKSFAERMLGLEYKKKD